MTGPMMVDTKSAEAGVEDNSRMTILGVVLLVLSATSGFLFGYDTGVVSGAMLLIVTQYDLNSLWHEMIVSGTILGAFVSCFLGGFFSDRYGRRVTITVAGAMFTIGSFVMALTPNKEVLLIGRLIVGIGVGLGSSSTPMYIAESAAPKFRGILVSCYVLGTTFGQAFAGVVCALLGEVDQGWRWMLGIAAIPSITLFVGFLFLPESPRWLVMNDRSGDAERVLLKLRGPDAYIGGEMKAIHESCEQQKQDMQLHPNVVSQIFKTPPVLRSLIVGCLLMAYQQLAGINTVMYYSATIIEMAGVSSDDSTVLWISAGVACVNFICTITGMYLIDKMGRRPLLLLSLTGAILSLILLGAGFEVMDTYSESVTDVGSSGCSAITTCSSCLSSSLTCGYCYSGSVSYCLARNSSSDDALSGVCASSSSDYTWAYSVCPSQYSWIPILALVSYLFFFAPGMGPIPWVINSEIHVTWARATCTSIATSANWLFNFIVSMVFLSLVDWITEAGTFYLFAGIAFTGLVIFWFYVPESRGIPLENVEDLFVGEVRKRSITQISSRRESRASRRESSVSRQAAHVVEPSRDSKVNY